jgi:hypothetical protein
VSRASSAIDISRLVTGLVTVNGNNREKRMISLAAWWVAEDSVFQAQATCLSGVEASDARTLSKRRRIQPTSESSSMSS